MASSGNIPPDLILDEGGSETEGDASASSSSSAKGYANAVRYRASLQKTLAKIPVTIPEDEAMYHLPDVLEKHLEEYETLRTTAAASFEAMEESEANPRVRPFALQENVKDVGAVLWLPHNLETYATNSTVLALIRLARKTRIAYRLSSLDIAEDAFSTLSTAKEYVFGIEDALYTSSGISNIAKGVNLKARTRGKADAQALIVKTLLEDQQVPRKYWRELDTSRIEHSKKSEETPMERNLKGSFRNDDLASAYSASFIRLILFYIKQNKESMLERVSQTKWTATYEQVWSNCQRSFTNTVQEGAGRRRHTKVVVSKRSCPKPRDFPLLRKVERDMVGELYPSQVQAYRDKLARFREHDTKNGIHFPRLGLFEEECKPLVNKAWEDYNSLRKACQERYQLLSPNGEEKRGDKNRRLAELYTQPEYSQNFVGGTVEALFHPARLIGRQLTIEAGQLTVVVTSLEYLAEPLRIVSKYPVTADFLQEYNRGSQRAQGPSQRAEPPK